MSAIQPSYKYTIQDMFDVLTGYFKKYLDQFKYQNVDGIPPSRIDLSRGVTLQTKVTLSRYSHAKDAFETITYSQHWNCPVIKTERIFNDGSDHVIEFCHVSAQMSLEEFNDMLQKAEDKAILLHRAEVEMM